MIGNAQTIIIDDEIMIISDNYVSPVIDDTVLTWM